MPITITAIVLNYRSPGDTVACVQALLAQTLAEQIEVIVVDNNSNDDSIGRLRVQLQNIKRVRIVENAKNSGYGAGNNLGARHANGEYLLFVNPDTLLEPTAVELLLSVLKTEPKAGLVAPKLVHSDGSVRTSARAYPTVFDVLIKRTMLGTIWPKLLQNYLQTKVDTTKPTAVNWVAGACLLLRKDLFKQLHGFDERFFLFFEDTDLCRRLWQQGYQVLYVPSATAYDRKVRLSDGNIVQMLFKKTGRIHMASAVKYFTKWGL